VSREQNYIRIRRKRKRPPKTHSPARRLESSWERVEARGYKAHQEYDHESEVLITRSVRLCGRQMCIPPNEECPYCGFGVGLYDVDGEVYMLCMRWDNCAYRIPVLGGDLLKQARAAQW
jgi:hypothetical protein